MAVASDRHNQDCENGLRKLRPFTSQEQRDVATMQVDVVTPEESLYTGEADVVYARSQEGEIGILPGHQPALLALAAGFPVRVQHGGTEEAFRVTGGFLEFRDNRLTVLADGLAED